METWFTFGILSGLFYALTGLASKKTTKGVDGYIKGLAYALFAVPFFVAALLYFKWVQPEVIFWPATLISVALNVIGTYCFMRSLELEEISLVMPLLSFTPVFLIFTSMIILKEFPSSLGVTGILLIVAGTYVLSLEKGKGFIRPIKSLLLNKGAQLMLLASFLYAILSNFDKIAITHSSPITFLVVAYSLAGLAFGLLVWKKSENGLDVVRKNMKFLLIIGLFSAVSVIFQMIAYQFAQVSYIIALKRTSGLFSVVLGYLVFKEKNTLPRLVGALIIVAGVVLIYWG